MDEIEKDAEDLLKSGKKLCDEMSIVPPLYSIAISLKRIADVMTFVPKLNEASEEEIKNLNDMMNATPFVNFR